MPTPPSRGFVRSRLDPSPPEPDLTPRDPPFRPRQALAESRAAGASDSPDAPRPLPARPRPPPGGAVELGVVESDEAMAQRLQREERERANASSRDAFYPNMPYDPARRAPPTSEPQPSSFLMPVPHHAPHPAPALSFSYPPPPPAAAPPLPTAESLGRRAMNDEIARNTGEPRGTWTAPVLHGGSYPREPASPYYPPVPTRGGESPGGESPGATETRRSPPGYRRRRTPPPPREGPAMAVTSSTTTRRSRGRSRRRRISPAAAAKVQTRRLAALDG